MSVNRNEVILRKLKAIIGEMSGIPVDAISPTESFLDLGFDSLFLTQANLRIRKEFKVKITFRQLFDEAPCLNALAAYLDSQLPEDALKGEPEAPPTPAEEGPAETGVSLEMSLPAVDWDLSSQAPGLPDLVRVLLLQSQTNSALLQALVSPRRAASRPSETPASVDGSLSPKEAGSKPASAAPDSRAREPLTAKALGPYKPIESGSLQLDERARAALDDFCRAYAERTRKSKELADAQRSVLSDARSISGFRRDWKEIVYQIAAGKGSRGCRVWDLDGNEYVDMTSSFGISLFGHSPDWAVEAAKQQIDAGFELGTLSPLAKEAAQLIRELTGMDRSTFTNTGSEALAAAVRAARTTTAKDRIAVFYDEYHGIGDELLVNCLETPEGRKTIPTSPGIPDYIVENVLVLKWDDDFLETIRRHADELAAVIIEPVQNRNPSLKTSRHFQAIRELTRQNNIALIFDEMITGFRLAKGGAQEYFGVEADIVCYGKIVSGGLPLAVVSGRGSYLDCFDGGPWRFGDESFPEAGVTFFGGTYTRHPVSVATCHAALLAIRNADDRFYDRLNEKSRKFAHNLNEILVGSGFPARVEHCESIFNLKLDNANPFSRLILWQLRHRGVLIYDRPFFMTDSHTEKDLDFVLTAFRESIDFLQKTGIVPATSLEGDSSGPRAVPFNLSQTEVWLATKISPEASLAFNEQVIYELDGPVDLAALRHAVQRVVQRHEGLRAREDTRGEGWIIDPARHVPVRHVDLVRFPDSKRKEEKDRLIHADIVEKFDLVAGPLVRFTLLTTDQDRHTLVVSAHHLVVDGWSMGVLLSDLARYYKAACLSERFGEPSPDSLSSFLANEREYLRSPEYRETEAFWLSQYAGPIPQPLQLPLDRSRPSAKTYVGERRALRFDRELVDRLKVFCAESKVTLFTTLYSAFSVLMTELTGQEDVVVGVPMAGQAVAGQWKLVGHAVNFLPLRTRVRLDRSFQDVLASTRDYILELNDHQRYTYASLLRKLPLKRTADHVPLVSVTFNVDQGMESFDFNGVAARYVTSTRGYVKHDLFVNVVLEEEAPLLEVDFNSDILDADTVLGWMARYFDLLGAAVDHPGQPLDSLTRTA